MNLTQGMSFAPKIIHNLRVLLERRHPADINSLCYNSFCIWAVPLLYTCVTGYVPYDALRVSAVFRVSLIILGLQPYIHKEFNFCFLFYWTY